MKKSIKYSISFFAVILLLGKLVQVYLLSQLSIPAEKTESTILFLEVIFYLGWGYTIFYLWKNTTAHRVSKVVWTVIIAFLSPPITTLIYLWLFEFESKKTIITTN